MKNINYFEDNLDFWRAASKQIIHTDVIIDIGAGILPQNFFRAPVHIIVEPFIEYVDILKYRYQDDKSYIIINSTADEVLPYFTENSVDTVFLIDVIEHMSKEIGLKVLDDAKRIARRQIVVFTPFGFIPQHFEEDGIDPWGLGGIEWQKHRTGWMPDDFDDEWNFYICKYFHNTKNFPNPKFNEPMGAMFAIKNKEPVVIVKPPNYSTITKPLPSEIELDDTKNKLFAARVEASNVMEQLKHTNFLFGQQNAQLAGAIQWKDSLLSQLEESQNINADLSTKINSLHEQLEEEKFKNATLTFQNEDMKIKLNEYERIVLHPAVCFQRKCWKMIKFWK